MGVPTDAWKRLKEEDKKSLIEATRGYEATKSAPATSSALNLQTEENGDPMEPLETCVGNVFVATSDDRCERFVEEWVQVFEGYSYPASGAVPVSSGAFPMSHREKLEPPLFSRSMCLPPGGPQGGKGKAGRR